MKTAPTKDEVVLGKLCIPYFLVHGGAIIQICLHHEPSFVEVVTHMLGILIEGWANRHYNSLSRRQPKWPTDTGYVNNYINAFVYVFWI